MLRLSLILLNRIEFKLFIFTCSELNTRTRSVQLTDELILTGFVKEVDKLLDIIPVLQVVFNSIFNVETLNGDKSVLD